MVSFGQFKLPYEKQRKAKQSSYCHDKKSNRNTQSIQKKMQMKQAINQHKVTKASNFNSDMSTANNINQLPLYIYPHNIRWTSNRNGDISTTKEINQFPSCMYPVHHHMQWAIWGIVNIHTLIITRKAQGSHRNCLFTLAIR